MLKNESPPGLEEGVGSDKKGTLPLPLAPLKTHTLLINDLWKSQTDGHRRKRKPPSFRPPAGIRWVVSATKECLARAPKPVIMLFVVATPPKREAQ